MNYLIGNKNLKLNEHERFSLLIRSVKKLKLKTNKDLAKVNGLSELIHKEWSELKKKYRRNLFRNTKMSNRTYSDYEAKEELLIGLIMLLKNKIIDFIL